MIGLQNLGAQVNVMHESIYKVLKQRSELKSTKVKLTTCNGSQILVISQCEGKINNWGKNVNLVFVVSSSKSAPILGLDSSVKTNSASNEYCAEQFP